MLYTTIVDFLTNVVYTIVGDEDMSLIYETVKKEKSRIEFMLNEYNMRLEILPKGTITEKRVNDKVYYYLKYREGGKIVSKYVSQSDKEKIDFEISERQHIETMIKSLKQELKFADKALGVKV